MRSAEGEDWYLNRKLLNFSPQNIVFWWDTGQSYKRSPSTNHLDTEDYTEPISLQYSLRIQFLREPRNSFSDWQFRISQLSRGILALFKTASFRIFHGCDWTDYITLFQNQCLRTLLWYFLRSPYGVTQNKSPGKGFAKRQIVHELVAPKSKLSIRLCTYSTKNSTTWNECKDITTYKGFIDL